MRVRFPPGALDSYKSNKDYMRREVSAGGVVFYKKGDKFYFLLIKNSSIAHAGVSYWGFPKGHIEENESSEGAANREVREETGVEATVVSKLGESKYVFEREGQKIFKIVIIFLMEYAGGDVKRQEEEISEAVWLSFDEALQTLSFSKDKEFLRLAKEILNE